MKAMLIFLVGFLTIAKSSSTDVITFYVHGGAIQSYKNDRITIDPHGNISLSSVSPTFAQYPNIIGHFKYKISKKDLTELKKLITINRKNIATPDHQPVGGSIFEELYIGNDKTFWTSRDSSKFIDVIRGEFLKLARQAYKNPIKALSLQCSQNQTEINCSYKNVGQDSLETVDPLGVSYSISCLDVMGDKKVLHELKEYNPKKMTPTIITIEPNDEYNFSIKTDHICDYRIVVKTTDMMINKNYKDVLLGELVSNQLTK